MFEVMIGEFDQWCGFDVWMIFGQLQPISDEKNVSGFYGLGFFLLVSTLSIALWTKTKNRRE